MYVFRPSSLNSGAVSHVENAPSPSREAPRANTQPATASGTVPPSTKTTRTPTLTMLKARFSLQNWTQRKKSASEPPSGEAISGSRTPFELLTALSGSIDKHTLTLREPNETIVNARRMYSRKGVIEEFDQWLFVRLQRSSETEVAKELHDSAQKVIDKQFAEEMGKGRGKRFKEWVKKEEAKGATVFEICHCVENAQIRISSFQEATVEKAVDKGTSEQKARKNFDRQITRGRTIIEALLYVDTRGVQNNDPAVAQYLTTEQKEQIKMQVARAQRKGPVMDHYDRELAELDADPSDNKTAAPPPSAKRQPPAKRQYREEQIAATREALDLWPGVLVSAGAAKLRDD